MLPTLDPIVRLGLGHPGHTQHALPPKGSDWMPGQRWQLLWHLLELVQYVDAYTELFPLIR